MRENYEHVSAKKSENPGWRVAAVWAERIAAILLGLWWLGMNIAELGGPGMSDTAVSVSAWGLIGVVATLVTLVWIGQRRWRALRVFAWIILSLMAVVGIK